MIQRIISEQLKKDLFKSKAIVLIGPRQVGKTTLLKEIGKAYGKPYLYINAEEPDILLQLENVTSSALKALFGNHELIIIDEAQNVNNIGRTLKLVTDTFPELQVIATGSSAFDLKNKTNEPLTGRKFEFQLFPISIEELNNHHGNLQESRLLSTRLIYGLYPEVINHPGEEERILRELSGSYLYKDLLMIDGLKKVSLLDKLLQALALQVGSEVSYNELGQLIGADTATVEKYIDLLEKAFVLFKLPALSRNHRNEIKKGKKIYFWDNGIRNAIIKSFNPIELRNDKGALWENFLISERMKHNRYHNNWVNSYFWRTFSGSEIDYIEEKNGTFYAFEFKWNLGTKKVKTPQAFSDAYPNMEFKAVDSNNYLEFVGGDN